MKHIIITGVSRGIGEALAKTLMDGNTHLYCVSRGDNPELRQMAKEKGTPLTYMQLDLSDIPAATAYMQKTLTAIKFENPTSVVLIHNAASLYPISAVGRQDYREDQLQESIDVNLTSPMLMTLDFVREFQKTPIDKKVLVISSGAARRPVHAWSVYCTTKAGLEMFCECLSLEQQSEEWPVRVLSIAPGVVDTAMQDYIRTKSPEEFHNVERFIRLKENDELWTPEYVATQLAEILGEEQFGEPVSQDLRERG